MLEPGTTVDPDGIAGRGGRLSAEIQSGKAAQPAGLRKPGSFCGAELSLPSSGRASPSLRRGWTKNKQKHNLNHAPGLTHGLDQKSEPGHSSSRRRAIELWQTDLPEDDREKLARMLFAFENPPGTKIFAGSQDSIGIVFPGLNRLDYRGKYWPEKITSVTGEKIITGIERHVFLIPVGRRVAGFDVLKDKKITAEKVRARSAAAAGCWH